MNSDSCELLSEFVSVAPEDWGAHTEDYGPLAGGARIYLSFQGKKDPYAIEDAVLAIFPDDDRASAEALVFLLDYLEEQGYEVDLFRPHTYDHYNCEAIPQAGRGTFTSGKTRIEAVTRAVVAVLKESA